VDNTPVTATGAAWTETLQYSQTVRTGDLVFSAGQGGFDATGELVTGGFDAQLRQTFANLDDVLRRQGAGLDTIVKLTVYLTDAADYDVFKRLRPDLLTAPFPASTAVVVKQLLADGMCVEIDAVAVVGRARRALAPTGVPEGDLG
jgi:2-iminobutanoate/2-iminopropanoate deaminase